MKTQLMLISLFLSWLTGCYSPSIERNLLLQYRSEEAVISEMEKYDLETQYKIFRHGNDVFHPSMTGLAGPIAKRGKEVIPFLMNKLDEEQGSDIALRDTLCILSEMSRSKYYDVKSDTKLMDQLTDYVSRSDSWKLTLSSQLNDIKNQ